MQFEWVIISIFFITALTLNKLDAKKTLIFFKENLSVISNNPVQKRQCLIHNDLFISEEVFGRYCNYSWFKNFPADNSCSRNAQLTFIEKPQMKKNEF